MLFLLLVVLVAVGVLLLGRRRFAAPVAGLPRGGAGAIGGRMAGGVADARADAQSWVDRLGGQLVSLVDDGDRSARQALADAAERHLSATRQLESANSVAQFGFARRTAIEGLYYVRAARVSLGLDPGPELPSAAAGVTVGAAGPGSIEVDGTVWTPSPARQVDSPYYFAGGSVGGRYAPAGWYAQPWWKTAAVAGLAGMGGMLLLDGLFDSFGHGGHGGGPGGFGGGGFGGGGFGGGGGWF